MKYYVFMKIEEDKEKKLLAYANDHDDATIGVDAPDIETAIELLRAGEAEALQAVEQWQPEPEEVPEIKEDQEDFESSAAGQRFIKALNTAETFTRKRDGSGFMGIPELQYLVNRANADVYDALMNMYFYAYRKGFMKGKKEGKADK